VREKTKLEDATSLIKIKINISHSLIDYVPESKTAPAKWNSIFFGWVTLPHVRFISTDFMASLTETNVEIRVEITI
jgi:hypothetical protein